MLRSLCMVLLAQVGMVFSEEFFPGQKDFGCELFLFENGKFKCAATLLGPNYAITDTSCAKFYSGSTFEIETGNKKERRTVKTITGRRKKITVLSWEEPIKESEGIKYIQLTKLTISDTCWITGPGVGEGENVKVNLLGDSQCPILSKQTCVKKSDKTEGSTCRGVVGSPLICKNTFGKWKLMGVAASKSPLCDLRKPTIFTKVSFFRNWLKVTEKIRLGTFTMYDFGYDSYGNQFGFDKFDYFGY